MKNTPQFARHRQPDELRRIIAKRSNVKMDTRAYDSGSDFVSITIQQSDDLVLNIAYNTFNGQFTGQASTKSGLQRFNERSTNLDGEEWYQDLLKLLFVPLRIKKGKN